ncbi:Rz1-like lysis system protein LysC [Methylobacillus glycogenes]|uniref:Rz1-like lysis system protein LysC n=1 Tax=Methylobacillus glycogenes TaxID=406 RepID=UPI0034E2B04C
MKSLSCGAILLCLLTLLGCNSIQTLPVPQIIRDGCPAVTQCTLPANSALTNKELRKALDSAEQAWHDCAVQVDMVHACQQKLRVQDHAQTSVN